MCNSNMTLPKVIGKLKASEECHDKATSGERKKNSLTRLLQGLRFQVTLKMVTSAKSALIAKTN